MPWNAYNIAKLANIAALCALSVSDFINEVTLAKGYPFYSVCYLTPIILLFTFVSAYFLFN